MAWNDVAGQQFLGGRGNAVIGFPIGHRRHRFDRHRASLLLYDVDVDERARCPGAATARIAELRRWAAEQSADEMRVLTEPDNGAARALHRSTGSTGQDEAVILTYDLSTEPRE